MEQNPGTKYTITVDPYTEEEKSISYGSSSRIEPIDLKLSPSIENLLKWGELLKEEMLKSINYFHDSSLKTKQPK